MKKSFVEVQRRRDDGLRYKHDLGQHFLYDQDLLRFLVASTGITSQDSVLEIGPGSGMLTTCLCEAAKTVVTVEADESILPHLRVSLEPFSNVTVVAGDILRQNLADLCAPLGDRFYVIANIPYNITTPLLEMLWESQLPIRQISVMVQKEVAEKLMASPLDENHSLISVKCQYYCDPSLVCIVPAETFTPPPKVDSAFISLSLRSSPPAPVLNQKLLFQLMKAGFGMRRKTLVNALKGTLPLDSGAVRDILLSQGFSPTVRGEVLGVAQWIHFANACHHQLNTENT